MVQCPANGLGGLAGIVLLELDTVITILCVTFCNKLRSLASAAQGWVPTTRYTFWC